MTSSSRARGTAQFAGRPRGDIGSSATQRAQPAQMAWRSVGVMPCTRTDTRGDGPTICRPLHCAGVLPRARDCGPKGERAFGVAEAWTAGCPFFGLREFVVMVVGCPGRGRCSTAACGTSHASSPAMVLRAPSREIGAAGKRCALVCPAQALPLDDRVQTQHVVNTCRLRRTAIFSMRRGALGAAHG
jgi:hypothetical protein